MERKAIPRKYLKPNKRKISIISMLKIAVLICLILFSIYIKFYTGNQSQIYKTFKSFFLSDQVKLDSFYKSIDSLLWNKNKINNKNKKKQEELAIFPAEGILNKNSDGSYFIIVKKETNVISPCNGTILKIEKVGESFDLLIDDNLNIYTIKNISIISNVNIGTKVSKGKLLGKIIPNTSNQQGFLYYKVQNK